jgi:hypothetical protein
MILRTYRHNNKFCVMYTQIYWNPNEAKSDAQYWGFNMQEYGQIKNIMANQYFYLMYFIFV